MADQFERLEIFIEYILHSGQDAPMTILELAALLSQPLRCERFLSEIH
ncbi:MAG: hypothetical protein KGN39_08910 [Betaproteobacteria bacterium]|nr:hypothetical protein [Betaproteobacteria bacterium]